MQSSNENHAVLIATLLWLSYGLYLLSVMNGVRMEDSGDNVEICQCTG